MDALDWLASHPWAGIAAALAGFLLLFAVLQLLVRAGAAGPEASRKLFHAGSGILTLSFPFIFRDLWPIILLTTASATLIGAVKFVPAFRRRFGGVTDRVERTTLGELYFPVSVALLAWLTHGQHPLLYVIPVMMLTFADATCALVGKRYGLTKYHGAQKSFEGSIAFLVVGFFCVHVPLLLWSPVGRIESLLIAATLALLVMMLEGSAWRGLDNLFIPIGGYFLLRAYVPMDEQALLTRLLATVALVTAILLARDRTTLEDEALAAGAFLCYVAWALMGWRWLVGPLVIVVGYRWLSPATVDNSRRMHHVPVVLSVWAPAVAWIAAAGATREPTLLYPYTIGFATHLAMFGISRLAHQFPGRSLLAIVLQAILASGALVLLPWLASVGLTPRYAAAAGFGFAAIGIGAGIFVATQPAIRDTAQDARRWTLQAAAASVASLVAWSSRVLLPPV